MPAVKIIMNTISDIILSIINGKKYSLTPKYCSITIIILAKKTKNP